MSFMKTILLLLAASACFSVAFAADPQAPPANRIFDGQVGQMEKEVVSLAEAMPADKYAFAPTAGEFKGVRTFSQQMTHIATVIYQVSSGALGEKCPVESGPDENGAASIQGKAAVVKYLKDSFAYAHKAAAAMTSANLMDMMPSPFGNGKMPRVVLISMVSSHSFDHYGQAVVYARMNGVIPPASR